MLLNLLLTALACGLMAACAFAYCVVLPVQSRRAPLPRLDADDLFLRTRLHDHICEIADGPRNINHFASLESAATYIEDTLREYGHHPQIQRFETAGRTVRNIEVVIEPDHVTAHTPTVILGGHYDTDGTSPGAHDNGTGVAAALELSRLLKTLQPKTHRLRLVFWVNEERPWGKTKNMGSWQHANKLRAENQNIVGAIALETLGYFTSEPNSQELPWPFNFVFPTVGNCVAFVALPGSRCFLEHVTRAFRASSPFPSIGGLAPGAVEGVDLSDHWAYHQFGIPALMVTDTAPFRNPYYHAPDDLPETVDYDSLAHITRGLEGMLRRLVS